MPYPLSEDERTRGDGVIFHPAWVCNNLKTISVIYIIVTQPIYITLVIKISSYFQISLESKSMLLTEASEGLVWAPHPFTLSPARRVAALARPLVPDIPSSLQPACCLLCSHALLPSHMTLLKGREEILEVRWASMRAYRPRMGGKDVSCNSNGWLKWFRKNYLLWRINSALSYSVDTQTYIDWLIYWELFSQWVGKI